MAKNYIGPGKVITVVCPAGGVSSGAPVLIKELAGVAMHDAIADADLELGVSGEFDVLADNNLVIDQGDRVFFDATNDWVDLTITAQQQFGIATAGKLTAGTTVRVLLGGLVPVAT